MRNLIFVFIIIIYSNSTHSQTSHIIDTLFRNSYKVFELQRLPNGMYRDAKLFSGTDYHPISIANTGMGLISLCIADAMDWSDNAKDLALSTLKSVTGHNEHFTPDRTSNGYFRHFLDVNTGQQAWNSEYSTIDTDILMSGALFCMKYFQDDSITKYVTELWNSIDFDASIMNPANGQIYLCMNANGTGVTNSIIYPYNEYMIVAWLAKNSSDMANSPGNILWDNYYSSPNLLPVATFNSIDVLSDNESLFLSSFTHQFNYYLCNYFTTSTAYLDLYKNSQKADSAWWNGFNTNQFEWGLGAGSAITNSYHADAIHNNPDTIVSPHIIAGFIPVYPTGKNDLIALWNNGNGKYLLPTGNNNDYILWRYSLNNPNWFPNEIIGIDYSTMLFGLATLPEYLGDSFFSTYNDFFPLSTNSISQYDSDINVDIYPNPTVDKVVIELEKEVKDINIEVISITGEIIFTKHFSTIKTINLDFEKNTGLYIVKIFYNGMIKIYKLCIN